MIWRRCSLTCRLVRPRKTAASAAPEGEQRSPNFAENSFCAFLN
jgi:hypothetical protein